jgi:hypothetical protein
MKNNTPDVYFKANPESLVFAFDLWESGKYSAYKKAIFYTTDTLTNEEIATLLAKAMTYKFDPNVIQVLGALRDEDKITMRYNESFLNMLQRIDLQTFKYSMEEKYLHEKPMFSMKGSLVSIALMKQILLTWLHDVRVIFV